MAITLDGTNGINSSGVIVAPDGSAAAPAITNDADTNTGIFFPAADTIAFAEGGAEAMRINSSGNVGIGTSSPSTMLHLSGSAAAGKDPTLTLANTTASTGRTYQIVSGDGGPLRFYDVTAAAERMRIDSSGNLLVGTTGDVNNGGFKFFYSYSRAGSSAVEIGHINGSASGEGYVTFKLNGGTIGSITQSGTTAVAYNTSSDYRLKENVAPMTGALAKVLALKPVTYTWKIDGSAGQGFIAHELQEVVPDCVTGEKDAVDADGNPQYQGVDTSFLVATLTAAIQEQQTIIDSLKARIEALENNNV